MNENRMPVVFSGHGSPMLALEHNEITEGIAAVGKKVLDTCGKPKAILAVSAHWYTDTPLIQSAANPEQIYDMYGFPEELYQVKYPVSGDAALTGQVQSILGNQVTIDDSWGIDHGTWTVLVHMFPDADIPVVQLSVSRGLSAGEIYEMGKKLSVLRSQGYLIFGSGNIVHNLMHVEWDNEGGTEMTRRFNQQITEAIQAGRIETVLSYPALPDASYAVPTPEHFLPLIYCLGAADGDHAEAFNTICNLGSMAMTGFYFSND